MIKPFLRFRQWHIMGCDSLENLGGWATCARGIRKLLKQTSTQHLQESFFVTFGISHCAQKFLHSEDSSPLTDRVKLAALGRLLGLSYL
jgi:hypothetical protein